MADRWIIGGGLARTFKRIVRMLMSMRGSGAAQVLRNGDNLTVFVPPNRAEIAFWGVIVSAGPDGEEDYTDHRYWVRRAWPVNDSDRSETKVAEFEGHPDRFPTRSNVTLLPGEGLPKIITATNLGEAVSLPGETDTGSHLLPVGTPVYVEAVFDRQTGRKSKRGRKYIIRATSPHVLHPCKVTQTGGSAGDATTQCSFTYTVTDIYGTQLGTEMSPLKSRPETGKLAAPTASAYGLGFWDEAGDFRLWDANETLASKTCS